MKVKLKRSAWEQSPPIDPATYGFDYDQIYTVEYVKEAEGIKSYKISGKHMYDADYFEGINE
jgi:hypothetical protein